MDAHTTPYGRSNRRMSSLIVWRAGPPKHENAIQPPFRTTRYHSPKARGMCGNQTIADEHMIPSKQPSANASCSASQQRSSIGAASEVRTCCRASRRMPGDKSTPATYPCLPIRRAAMSAAGAVPVATSRMRWLRPSGARSTKRRANCQWKSPLRPQPRSDAHVRDTAKQERQIIGGPIGSGVPNSTGIVVTPTNSSASAIGRGSILLRMMLNSFRPVCLPSIAASRWPSMGACLYFCPCPPPKRRPQRDDPRIHANGREYIVIRVHSRVFADCYRQTAHRSLPASRCTNPRSCD